MATKIERIDREITKTREKIAEYQEKLKTLEAQKTEAENLEIVQMVRAMRMTPGSALAGFVKKTLPGVVCASVETPEQLNAMLSGGTVPGMAAASADYNEQEDTAHEE